MSKGALRVSEVLSREVYRAQRKTWLSRGVKATRLRRVELGPELSVTFQSRDMVLQQVQEMLLAEPGGVAEEEVEAYAPLVPDGKGLRFVMMVEVENEKRRGERLRQLVGVETHLELRLDDGRVVPSSPIDDNVQVERVKDGKTSAVHFGKFEMTGVAGVKKVDLACTHSNYSHVTTLSNETWQEIKKDLD